MESETGWVGLVHQALDNHKKFRSAYFWTSDNGNSKNRSYQADRESFTIAFSLNGDVYKYQSVVSVSRKRVHYRGIFTLNGQRGDVRLFKKLVQGSS